MQHFLLKAYKWAHKELHEVSSSLQETGGGKNWGGRGMKLPFNAFPMKHLGKPRKFPFRGCPEDVCSLQPATTILTQSLPNPNLSNSWGHPLWFGQKKSWGMGNNWERKLSFSHQVTYQGMIQGTSPMVQKQVRQEMTGAEEIREVLWNNIIIKKDVMEKDPVPLGNCPASSYLAKEWQEDARDFFFLFLFFIFYFFKSSLGN